MQPRRWFSLTQLQALTEARIASGQWGGTWKLQASGSIYSPWDGGIEGRPRVARGETQPIPFFLLAPLPEHIVPGSVRPWVPFIGDERKAALSGDVQASNTAHLSQL